MPVRNTQPRLVPCIEVKPGWWYLHNGWSFEFRVPLFDHIHAFSCSVYKINNSNGWPSRDAQRWRNAHFQCYSEWLFVTEMHVVAVLYFTLLYRTEEWATFPQTNIFYNLLEL